MKKGLVALLACGIVALGCDNSNPANPLPASSAAQHSVAFENSQLSLAVSEHPDGRVTGEWAEELAKGLNIRLTPTCLLVRGGQAWVGGVVSHASMASLVGQEAVVRINRSGATSYTIVGGGDCKSAPAIPLLRARIVRASVQ